MAIPCLNLVFRQNKKHLGSFFCISAILKKVFSFCKEFWLVYLPRRLGVAATPPRPEGGQDARRGEVRTAWSGPHAHGPGPAARRLRTRAQRAGGSGPARDRLGAAGEIAPKWRPRVRARAGDPLPRRAARATGSGRGRVPGAGPSEEALNRCHAPGFCSSCSGTA